MTGARHALVAAALAVAAAAGCATPRLDRDYGKSSGVSLDGTRVFFDVLKARGHDTRRVSSFQNRFLDDASVVVWFERDPDGVSWTSVEEAAGWLSARPDRTLLYVANDFQSDLALWDDLAGFFHATGQSERAERSRGLAAKVLTALEARAEGRVSKSWALYPFAFADRSPSAERAAPLEASTPMARDLGAPGRVYLKRHPSAVEPPAAAVDALDDPESTETTREAPPAPDAPAEPRPPPDGEPTPDARAPDDAEVEIHDINPSGKRIPPESPGAQTLRALRDQADRASDAVWLGSDGRALVLARQLALGPDRQQRSRVVLVHNASFLLNYALVDPVHRTLAARLADQLGERQRIAFYEPTPGGGRIWSPWGRLPPGGPSPIDVLFRPPLGWVFLHLLIAALLYLANQAPIFGRPRTDREQPGAPFTEHVRAYGKLLERTGDRAYVDTLLAEHARRPR